MGGKAWTITLYDSMGNPIPGREPLRFSHRYEVSNWLYFNIGAAQTVWDHDNRTVKVRVGWFLD
jgi:hypothetical protein